jgi:diguanylate cyclase (GGDEF)-like protein/hemerythrin-like metal-binding protein
MRNVALPAVDAQIGLRSLGELLAHSSVVALAVLRQGRIAFANPAFHAEFHATGSLVGVALADIVTDVRMDRLEEALVAARHAPVTYFGVDSQDLDTAFDVKLDLEGAVLDGEPVVLACASRLTERHQPNEPLTYLAYSDPLTGVPNRALFADRLHQALLAARRSGSVFAVLMVDLDGFKAVNDAHGHDVGDTVLQLVVQRFQRCVRDADTLARLGGDEFAVLLPRLDDPRSASVVAQRLLDALKEPLDLRTYGIAIGASVGIATYPEHAVSADALVTAADTALLCAKRAGKNQFQWAVGRSQGDASPLSLPTWTVAHSVGIDEVDRQHAKLAKLIDTLSAALKDSVDRARIGAELARLVSYTAFHFASEERLMTEFGIASLAAHRNAHSRLLRDIKSLDVADDLPSISLVLRYLREWLLRHIDGFDRELGRELIAKGCR